jgi:hypothetical protein
MSDQTRYRKENSISSERVIWPIGRQSSNAATLARVTDDRLECVRTFPLKGTGMRSRQGIFESSPIASLPFPTRGRRQRGEAHD